MTRTTSSVAVMATLGVLGCPGTPDDVAGQQGGDLIECAGGVGSVPSGPVPAALQGSWLFSDITFDIDANGVFVPNGGHRVQYDFTPDGAFTYQELITVMTDQLPTESTRCETSLFSMAIGNVSEANGTLRLGATHGSQIAQAQACANDYLRKEAWCPSSSEVSTPWSISTEEGREVLTLRDLTTGETRQFERNTGE